MVNMVDNKALKVFTYIFFALVVADIIALNIYDGQSVFTADNFILHVFIKPLIMLSAICFLIKYVKLKCSNCPKLSKVLIGNRFWGAY